MTEKVPMPEGFELRDRRSTKEHDANLWSPQDAVYCASQSMKDPVAAIILWRERDSGDLRFTRAGPKDANIALLARALKDFA